MARTTIHPDSDMPSPANDVPLVVMVAPNHHLRVQRAVFSAIGVRFLGFQHGDTALLSLLTSPAAAILVGCPADMTVADLLADLRAQGETAPVVRMGDDRAAGEEPLPLSPAAARSLLVRIGVLSRPLRPIV